MIDGFYGNSYVDAVHKLCAYHGLHYAESTSNMLSNNVAQGICKTHGFPDCYSQYGGEGRVSKIAKELAAEQMYNQIKKKLGAPSVEQMDERRKWKNGW